MLFLFPFFCLSAVKCIILEFHKNLLLYLIILLIIIYYLLMSFWCFANQFFNYLPDRVQKKSIWKTEYNNHNITIGNLNRISRCNISIANSRNSLEHPIHRVIEPDLPFISLNNINKIRASRLGSNSVCEPKIDRKVLILL